MYALFYFIVCHYKLCFQQGASPKHDGLKKKKLLFLFLFLSRFFFFFFFFINRGRGHKDWIFIFRICHASGRQL